MILQILGWTIVIWLLGSTIYSTQFHLRNYFHSKNKERVVAEDLEGPNQRKVINRSTFLQHVISAQIIKIVVIILLIYSLLLI